MFKAHSRTGTGTGKGQSAQGYGSSLADPDWGRGVVGRGGGEAYSLDSRGGLHMHRAEGNSPAAVLSFLSWT